MKFILLYTAVLFLGLNLQAQNKRNLTHEDYKLWSTLFPKEISPYGDWVSYRLKYENADTTFIRNTSTDQRFVFPSAIHGEFTLDNEHYVSLTKNKVLKLISLDEDVQLTFKEVERYEISKSGRYIAILQINNVKKSILQFLDIKTKQSQTMGEVKEFCFDPSGYNVAYVNNRGVGIFNFSDLSKKIITRDSEVVYNRLTWNKSGNALAFFGRNKSKHNALLNAYLYKGKKTHDKLYTLNLGEIKQFPDGMQLVNTNTLRISKDGNAVFLDVQSQSNLQDKTQKNDVQIWHSTDKDIYPHHEKWGAIEFRNKLSVWYPVTGAFRRLCEPQWSDVVIGPNEKYALAWNNQVNKPAIGYDADADIYLVEIKTGKRQKILAEFSSAFNHWGVHISPEGKYLCYFKDKHWWIYNIETQERINVTQNLKNPTYNMDYYTGTVPAYGNPGWSKNDREIIIYDEFDLWALSTDGKSKRRLTQGREQGITYRIYPKLYEKNFYPEITGSSFDLSKELVLTANNSTTKESGYSIWKTGTIKNLVYGDYHIDHLKKAKYDSVYMYTKQRFDLSPVLFTSTGKSTSEKELLKTNLQQKQFHWGKSRLIQYVNKDGEKLQAALYYPANYTPNNTYPMIVSIYEKKSNELHRYWNPDFTMEDGLVPTNFVSDGYFVLYPDINYEINNPGVSAVQCVSQAVTTALCKEIGIDRKRIGLIGHSFGGYETTFIITQTNIFAAAIAGAAPTDLISDYLSVGWGSDRPNAWRYETQHYRFTGPYYELKKAYIINSPIYHIQNINTPLLSEFGDKDLQVNWHQGLEMYNAMRRLGKKHVLLIYPGEGHVLHNKHNLIDYSQRIQDWFEHYLKNEKPAEWIYKTN